ncbi:MAG: DUF6653 family protein [Pseudomonadota bacterium]
MGIDRFLERGMAMSESAWRRHANPWSVLTRIPILPLLAAAIYARVWIGWWCLLPVGLLIAWTFINPRAFPAPARLDSWASRGVMGERIWLARREDPIPKHHERAAAVLGALSGLGLPVAAYGLLVLDPWATAAGVILTTGAKMWFVDRMVWLYDEVGDGRFTSRS